MNDISFHMVVCWWIKINVCKCNSQLRLLHRELLRKIDMHSSHADIVLNWPFKESNIEIAQIIIAYITVHKLVSVHYSLAVRLLNRGAKIQRKQVIDQPLRLSDSLSSHFEAATSCQYSVSVPRNY